MKEIHPLMKILSVILHLQAVEVEREVDGSTDLSYTTFHIKTERDAKKSAFGLNKINELLGLDPERLETLMIFGEYDHVTEKSFKDR